MCFEYIEYDTFYTSIQLLTINNVVFMCNVSLLSYDSRLIYDMALSNATIFFH